MMSHDFTAVYQAAEEGGYVAWAEELPGTITQGETLEEARENLAEAIHLVLEANRELSQLGSDAGAIIRERITVRG